MCYCFIFPFAETFGFPGKHGWIDSFRCTFLKGNTGPRTHLSAFSPLLTCPKGALYCVTVTCFCQRAVSTCHCLHYWQQLPFCFLLLPFLLFLPPLILPLANPITSSVKTWFINYICNLIFTRGGGEGEIRATLSIRKNPRKVIKVEQMQCRGIGHSGAL